MKEEIWISLPESDHGYGLKISSENQSTLKSFKALVTNNEGIKILSPFLQSDCRNFIYFEFLIATKKDEDLIFDTASSIAQELGLSLNII